MKHTILMFAIATASILAQADSDFDAKKTNMTSNIDKRIESLNKLKSCIQGATSEDSVKPCRNTHRMEMDAIHDGNIDTRIQKLQERKDKKKNH
ncbi:MAG: hypothetical protein AB7O96_17230 [Pseudobdellovibrionaceae bacterium]